MRKKLLPHPFSSASLLFFWLWLNNSLAPGHFVLGAIVGWLLPFLTGRLWPDHIRVSRPWVLVGLLGRVAVDVVTANLRVARAILGPVRRLRPGFVEVPLDVRSDTGIAVLANTITLTPGTLSADVSADRRHLVVHFLDEADPAAMVAEIKNRYERPIMEVFG